LAQRLSERIREAFVVAAQRPLSRRNRRRRAMAGHRKAQGRDAYLEDLIRRYRADPATWSPVLLEAIGPAAVARIAHFVSPSPVIDAEDVAQELILQLLLAAATMPLPHGARWVERRLVLRAGTGVSRWLQREANYQRGIEPRSEVDDEADQSCD